MQIPCLLRVNEFLSTRTLQALWCDIASTRIFSRLAGPAVFRQHLSGRRTLHNPDPLHWRRSFNQRDLGRIARCGGKVALSFIVTLTLLGPLAAQLEV